MRDGVRNLGDLVLSEIELFAGGQTDERTHVGDVIARESSDFQPLQLAELGRQSADLVVRGVQKCQALQRR